MIIILNGNRHEISADRYGTLQECIAALGYRLDAPCGGHGRCGKCRVTVANPGGPTAAEMELLSDTEIAAGVRLACLTRPFDGMSVQFDERGAKAVQIVTEGQSVRYPFSPRVRLKKVQLPKPSLDNPVPDTARLAQALGLKRPQASRAVLAALPQALREGGWAVSAAVAGTRVMALNPARLLGLAVDIGTTTLAAYLLDLTTGAELGAASALNPQKAYGDDVISRADYARSGGLDTLRQAVAKEIGALAGRLCAESGTDLNDIYHAVVAGNSIMLHLLAGVTPEHISVSPFTPVFTEPVELPAAELIPNLNPETAATLLPSVAGYVGADITAGMLAAGMSEASEPTLLIDIGTNGEIALAARGKLFACATAAGPAFEGAHIACGMGGVAGAINWAEMRGGLRFGTVGGAPAAGICGSGLVDLVAGLLDCGALDTTGKIDCDAAPQWLTIEGDRVVLDREAGIYLTGRDIREVQLAKGAIAAGVEVLARQAGIAMGDIRRVYLSGGFGSFMDKRSAGRIGLIPSELVDRTSAIGNSSGAGAKAALLSRKAMREAARLARAVQYVELSACKDFNELYMEKMLF